eukprot:jgi/Mesvir1/7075/Mv09186-RA.2
MLRGGTMLRRIGQLWRPSGAARWFSQYNSVGAGVTHLSSGDLIKMEGDYSAHNYKPIPAVFSKGTGVHVVDPEGKIYLDFLSAYSALNQGHCHPRIVSALVKQASDCTLSSRAFHNDRFPQFAKRLTELLGFEMVLPMNTGAEGVETAVKLARKWAYQKKGVPAGQALLLSCCGCFHGRTLIPVSMSCDPDTTREFGPLVPGMLKVDYGDADAVEAIFKEHGPRLSGFILEPIQGEAGVVVPPDGYLKRVRELCTQYNVLMIADEVQTGIARTGRMLACDHEGVKPDILVLGKAISGGVLPVSAVLSSKEIMLCIKPGEHGSTFGGNPLSSAVAMAAMDVVVTERLSERAEALGVKLRAMLNDLKTEFPDIIDLVRGKGLLNAVVINKSLEEEGVTAYDICYQLKNRGVLAKATHGNIIRLTPPLVIQ